MRDRRDRRAGRPTAGSQAPTFGLLHEHRQTRPDLLALVEVVTLLQLREGRKKGAILVARFIRDLRKGSARPGKTVQPRGKW